MMARDRVLLSVGCIGLDDKGKDSVYALNPKLLIQALEKLYPDLWPLLMPRIYKNSDHYCSTKIPTASMISCVSSARDGLLEFNRPMKAVFAATEHMTHYNMQTLFIGADLCKAAMLSSPPEGMKWMDLRMPYEAAIFMLPKGTIKDNRGFEYDFIGYSRRRKGSKLSAALANQPNEVREMEVDSFTSFTMATNGDGSILESAWTPEMSPYITDLQVDPIIPANSTELKLSEEETSLMRLLSTLVFRICLILEARPTLLSSGRRIGSFKKREGVEVWTPNVIGLNYKIKSEGLEATAKGSHASPRMHWRRGHTRRQQIGHRDVVDKQYKIVWIEPCLIGGAND